MTVFLFNWRAMAGFLLSTSNYFAILMVQVNFPARRIRSAHPLSHILQYLYFSILVTETVHYLKSCICPPPFIYSAITFDNNQFEILSYTAYKHTYPTLLGQTTIWNTTFLVFE